MTDADVDGAHIATLLMTFFFQEMSGLVRDGHVFIAQPPLYRLSAGGTIAYARDDAHKEELEKTTFKNKKVEENGRATCRERVWQYVSISVCAVSLKKTIRNRTKST